MSRNNFSYFSEQCRIKEKQRERRNFAVTTKLSLLLHIQYESDQTLLPYNLLFDITNSVLLIKSCRINLFVEIYKFAAKIK